MVTPREVFKTAILNNAYCIAVAHNHPSSDPTESKEDIEVTKKLLKAGDLTIYFQGDYSPLFK